MKLILEWSTGEYDDYCHYVIPFEWESPEALYLLIEEKKKEYKFFLEQCDNKHREAVRGKIPYSEYLEFGEKEFPHPVVDSYFHKLCVEQMQDRRQWAEVEIMTIDEWFERR